MSDDFTNIKTFVTDLVTTLKTNVTRTAADGTGGLFPNGVNDIYAKITIGGVHVELEISSADVIHAEAMPGSPKRLEPPDGQVEQYVRPMYVCLPAASDNTPIDILVEYKSAKTGSDVAKRFPRLGVGNYKFEIGEV